MVKARFATIPASMVGHGEKMCRLQLNVLTNAKTPSCLISGVHMGDVAVTPMLTKEEHVK